MDTVKLDIQKLQLLNDRIAQTLEALNQVRLSVHGLQSAQQGMGVPVGAGQGQIPMQPGFAGNGANVGSWGGIGMGANPFAAFGGQSSPYNVPQFGGLQHTGIPYGQPFLGGSSGFVTPFIGGGIGHSSAGYDPMWQLRAMQTFPFAQYPYVPGMY